MSNSRGYDTVAFDVRENTAMLFFAKTNKKGDIDEYLLLMRTEREEFNDPIYIEMNDNQFSGHNLIQEVRLTGNVLTLELREPAAELDGASEIVLTYDETPENQANIEAGVIGVLFNTLAGGNA
jgi:hypothetical protein